ncbi:MAG: GntR family transcriptional regulator [Anaerorhabdus sp.]
MRKREMTIPKYQQIAADIAMKIVNDEYQEGDKLFARSSLATRYGVSSETARRAVSILQDLGIVVVTKGSGVLIASCEKASLFVQLNNEARTISDLHDELLQSAQRQNNEMNHFNEKLEQLLSQTERFQSLNVFNPYKIKITKEMQYLGKSIAEIQFWQHTFATVIAIKKEDQLILSPGPYMMLEEEMVLYFIGNEECVIMVQSFLNPKK